MGRGQIDGDAADGEGETGVFNGRTHPFPGLVDGGVRQVHRYWDRNGEMCDMDFIASHHDANYGDDGNTARIGLWLAPGQMEVLRVSYD